MFFNKNYLNKRIKIKTFNRKNEKIKKRIVPITIIGLLLIGFIFQQLSIHFTASKLGRMGKLVDIDGTSMHLYEAGTSDIPIVFASNIGNSTPYVDLYPLHQPLSQEHHVMVYDRPGYGWSDTTSKPRDIDTICEEIHSLLHSNDVPDDEDESLKPFVYVAQGMASLEAIRYAQLYPEDIAGLVFIEGTSPAFCEDYNNIMIIESFMVNALRNTGVLRLLGNTKFALTTVNDNPELSMPLRKLNKGLGLNHTWNRNVIAEKLNISENATKIIETFGEDNFGELPICVITSNANTYTTWNKCQRGLLALSEQSTQTLIDGSTTVINKSDVPAILNSIETLIDLIEEQREDY